MPTDFDAWVEAGVDLVALAVAAVAADAAKVDAWVEAGVVRPLLDDDDHVAGRRSHFAFAALGGNSIEQFLLQFWPQKLKKKLKYLKFTESQWNSIELGP